MRESHHREMAILAKDLERQNLAQETYTKAPITEAVLDIRVRLDENFDYTSLKNLLGEAPGYPNLRQAVQFKLQWTKEEGTPLAESHEEKDFGYVLSSQDGLQLFQARQDGFSHNRLAPYQSWESFKKEAMLLWALYKKAASPLAIEMLGLTYINKLEMPLGADISDYIPMFVHVPSGMPQTVEQYSMSIQLVDTNGPPQPFGPRVSVFQAFAPPTSPTTVAMMVTLRAFQPIKPEDGQVSEDMIWESFEGLRSRKNNAFESLITDRIREVIR